MLKWKTAAQLHTHTHTHTHTHIYIYIYIVSHRQTVLFYQNSSVWLDRQDSRSWDRNLANCNTNPRFYHSTVGNPAQAKEIYTLMYHICFVYIHLPVNIYIYIYIYIYISSLWYETELYLLVRLKFWSSVEDGANLWLLLLLCPLNLIVVIFVWVLSMG